MDMKTDKKQLKKDSKKAEVPKTEVSLAQAQTAKHFYLITSLILAVIIIGGGYASYKLFNSYIHKSNEIKAQDKLIHSLNQKKKTLRLSRYLMPILPIQMVARVVMPMQFCVLYPSQKTISHSSPC